MVALRRPLAMWLTFLAISAIACSAWLFGYFLEERRWFLARAQITSLGEQLVRAIHADTSLSLRLFLLSPWLAASLAVLCVVLIWRTARGSRAATILGALTVLLVPATYVLGIHVLRQLEDQIYFDRSPWVIELRAGCAVLAVTAVAAIAWSAVRLHRSGRQLPFRQGSLVKKGTCPRGGGQDRNDTRLRVP
jgi:hypothetical protein